MPRARSERYGADAPLASRAVPATLGGRMSARTVLDLRGVRCPLSWARAKVHLEGLPHGHELDLLLDDPQGARDIPRAAEGAGHHVVRLEGGDGIWMITIEA